MFLIHLLNSIVQKQLKIKRFQTSQNFISKINCACLNLSES